MKNTTGAYANSNNFTSSLASELFFFFDQTFTTFSFLSLSSLSGGSGAGGGP